MPLLAHTGIGPLLLVAVTLPIVSHLVLWAALSLSGERRAVATAGYICAFQTQSAALAFAAQRLERGRLHLAYATVYPVSLISKILLAQVLLNLP